MLCGKKLFVLISSEDYFLDLQIHNSHWHVQSFLIKKYL